MNQLLLDINGFTGNGIHSKIKKSKMDLGLIYSEKPCVAAGVFTKNKSCAAPVKVSKKHINEPIKAIIINSGNANACTGVVGLKDANRMCEAVAKELNLKKEEVLVCSTGIIGKPLPMDNILEGISKVSKDLSYENFNKLPEAIHTTDTTLKTSYETFNIKDQEVKINGFAKGSGMIHPNMATTLGFITTNANISKKCLDQLLISIADETFNMISVDGDTSTNDSLIVLTNNESPHEKITNENSPGYGTFKSKLHKVIESLAIQVVKDGEGASKLITVNVQGALSSSDAKKQAKSIINSNLVKSAFFGEDVNWGRILCALGYSNTEMNPDIVDLDFSSGKNKINILKKGKAIQYNADIAEVIMSHDEITIHVNLNLGQATATAWGCDLSLDYVKINACYEDSI